MKENETGAMSVQEIKELMEAFAKCHMGSLKIKQGDFELKLEGQKIEQIRVGESSPIYAEPLPNMPAATAAPAEPAHSGTAVTSPIVGTFYAAPAPDKDAYVQVGSQVKKGDVLFIIESMKLMNEVTSDRDGVVTEIVAENAQGVEYGQPILYIQ